MNDREYKRRRAARLAEQAEWKKRADEAKAVCDALNDPAELADAARAYLLAKADHEESWRGPQGKPFVDALRRRANSPAYRLTLAAFWLVERLKKAADDATGLSAAETKAIEDQQLAESRAFLAALNGLIEGGVRRLRS